MEHQDRVLSSKEQWGIFKRLLKAAVPYKKQLAAAALFLLVGTSADLVGPILVKVFIDDYLTQNTFPAGPLVLLGVSYAVLHLLAVVLGYYQIFWFQRIALQIIRTLRIDVFKKVEHSRLRFFDRTAAGGLISRLTNDTESVKEMYVEVLAVIIHNGVFLIGVFIAMAVLDLQLALLCLALFPIIIVLIYYYRKKSAVYFGAMSGRLSMLNAKINESIQGMNIIQVFRQEKRMRHEFEEINEKHRRSSVQTMKLDGLLLRPAIDLISVATLVLVLTYFGLASFEGSIQLGVLYAFINYIDRLFEPVNQIMQQLSKQQQAIVSAGRVFQILDRTEDMEPEAEHARTGSSITEGNVRFDRVSFGYDAGNPVLKDISFQVNKGETLAIVGHTGSGKSSIVQVLLRFYDTQKGTITVDGTNIHDFANKEIRSNIGLVLQDPFLFSGTVKDNIKFHDPDITEQDMKRAAEKVEAAPFINKLPEAYEEPVGERGSSFSNGEKQLITFARTIAKDPKILVLDEATASIDSETEQDIQTALERMKQGRTTIMIAHRLSTIKDADHIIVLHQGEIREEGSHESLLEQNGLYRTMYELQQGKMQQENTYTPK
ncbi:ABC transporter ATP-binding protein [Sinobaca sp. H24]|uniref:ABC transporter ATP-binding protein n=1 Tax=Sinobaca sp. H24 TaxID=2923376 RepID=UPI002079A6BF|nr:ABC transporter ATP-binding protein [Sinobaca sp. H24]